MHEERDDIRHPACLGRNSFFLSYVSWFEGVQGSLSELSGSDVALFPCVLPYPEVLQIDELEGEEQLITWWAKTFMNMFVCWSNFVVLGSPRPGAGAYEPRVAYRGFGDARQFADRLLGEVIEFSSVELILGKLSCEGKRAAIADILSGFPCTGAFYGDVPFQVSGSGVTTALPVVADRLAVPEDAGKVDPVAWLPPDRAAVVRDLVALRLPEEEWDEVPRSCHRVAPEEEAGVAERLLSTGMATLVDEVDLPRNRAGDLMTGGLFAVAKSGDQDRLIFDRRPENAAMASLDWGQLPSGACFTRALLKPSEFLRGSGDDLKNFYYNLRLPENWVRYNSVGRRVDDEVARRHGGHPGRHYRLCLRVLGMGDKNGVAIAQAVHEGVLKHHGLLEPRHVLVYGRHTPTDPTWQGIYIDDLLITQRVDVGIPVSLDGSFKPPPVQDTDQDAVFVAKAERAYDEAGFQRALHKRFRHEVHFRAWGAEIDGVLGRAGAPLDLRRQVWLLLHRVISTGWASKLVLQRIVGYTSFIFQYRRELYCLQHRVYVFLGGMAEDRWIFLPAWLLDELRSFALHLPFAVWSMRRHLSTSVLATDATPTSGGAVRASCPEKLVHELWRRTEVRGAPVRLDRDYDFLPEALLPLEASKFGGIVAECLSWQVCSSFSFRETAHINLQEARALKREVVKLASDFDQGGSIQIALNDSLVVVGATCKGRSSSFRLNGILRTQLPFLIMGNITLALIWIETSSNLADYPSRFRPLPPPQVPPLWLQRFGLSAQRTWTGLEIFAGAARLTHAHKQVGVGMLDPVDLLYGANVHDDWIDQAIGAGKVRWVWLAPPSSSFARHVCRGELLGSFGARWRATQLWQRALELASQIIRAGGYFFLVHPRNSRAWSLRETELFLKHEGLVKHAVDLRLFWDGPPAPLPPQQPFAILSNAPWLFEVVQKSSKAPSLEIEHGTASAKSGAYPWKFCFALSDALARWIGKTQIA